MAEVTEVLGPLCAPYAKALLSIVLEELAAAADDTNSRNAAFCAGVLAQHAPDVLRPHLPRLLQARPRNSTVVMSVSAPSTVLAKINENNRRICT